MIGALTSLVILLSAIVAAEQFLRSTHGQPGRTFRLWKAAFVVGAPLLLFGYCLRQGLDPVPGVQSGADTGARVRPVIPL